MKITAIVALLVIMLAPVAAVAEEMILESQANVGVAGLKKCDILHHIRTCDLYHFTPETAQSINLDGQEYTVTWMGLGYYFAGGLILQATEDGRWLEVAPQEGQLHTASWIDADASGALSILDSLVIDGQALTVKDVRLQVRVRPALK